MSLENDLWIGNHQYTDLQEIGVGGAAVVYKGIFEVLDCPVVVKILHPEHNGNGDGSGSSTKDKFYREAELTSKLQSPYIVKVHDFDTNDPIKIVYDYVEGLDLRDIRNLLGKLPEVETLVAMEWVCSALEEAHLNGITHRDVSPGNILIPKGTHRARLADFGIAASKEQYRSGEKDAEFVGVKRYSSPQQQNREPADPSDDQYALGRTAVDLLTGRNPERTILEKHGKQMKGIPIHKNILRILRKVTSMDDKLRYPSIKDVRHEIRGHRYKMGVETVGAMESRLGDLLKSAYSSRERLDKKIDASFDDIGYLSAQLQESTMGKDSLRLLAYHHRHLALDIFEDWFVENLGNRSVVFPSLKKIQKMSDKRFTEAYEGMYDAHYPRNPASFRDQVSDHLNARLADLRSYIGTLLKVNPQGYKRFTGRITEQVEKTLQANDGDFIFRQEADTQASILGAYQRSYNMVARILMNLEPQNPLHGETAVKIKDRMDELEKAMNQ